MRLDPEGREYWEPEMTAIPVGFVAIKAKFKGSTDPDVWVPIIVVEGKRVVLIAGPAVDVVEAPHPAGTVVLPVDRTLVKVKLIGPDGVEVLIRDGGPVDVRE